MRLFSNIKNSFLFLKIDNYFSKQFQVGSYIFYFKKKLSIPHLKLLKKLLATSKIWKIKNQ